MAESPDTPATGLEELMEGEGEEEDLASEETEALEESQAVAQRAEVQTTTAEGAGDDAQEAGPPPVEAEARMTEAALAIRGANAEQQQLELQTASLAEVQGRVAVEDQALGSTEGLVEGQQAGLDQEDAELEEKAASQEELSGGISGQSELGAEAMGEGMSVRSTIELLITGVELVISVMCPLVGAVNAAAGMATSIKSGVEGGEEAGGAIEEDATASEELNTEMGEQTTASQEESSLAREQVETMSGQVAADREANAEASALAGEALDTGRSRVSELEGRKSEHMAAWEEAHQQLLDWVEARREGSSQGSAPAADQQGSGSSQEPADETQEGEEESAAQGTAPQAAPAREEEDQETSRTSSRKDQQQEPSGA